MPHRSSTPADRSPDVDDGRADDGWVRRAMERAEAMGLDPRRVPLALGLPLDARPDGDDDAAAS